MAGNKGVKRLRRETALKRVDEVRKLADVKLNDTQGIHWTLTLPNGFRVDYWPSTQKWQSALSGFGRGDFDDFLKRMARDGGVKKDNEIRLPDWFVREIADLKPEPRAVWIKVFWRCIKERAQGAAFGERFKQLLDHEIFGRRETDREITVAFHVDFPVPGVRLTYSDGFTKFEADADRWTRAAA